MADESKVHDMGIFSKKDIRQLTDEAIILNDDVDFEYDELSGVHVFGE